MLDVRKPAIWDAVIMYQTLEASVLSFLDHADGGFEAEVVGIHEGDR